MINIIPPMAQLSAALKEHAKRMDPTYDRKMTKKEWKEYYRKVRINKPSHILFNILNQC